MTFATSLHWSAAGMRTTQAVYDPGGIDVLSRLRPGRHPETTANLSAWLAEEGWSLVDQFAATDNTSSPNLGNLTGGFPAFSRRLSSALLDEMWREKQAADGGGGGGSSNGGHLPAAALSIGYTQPTTLPFGPPGGLPLPALEVPTLMFQSKQMHALPTLLASLYDARLRQATGGASTLAAATHPLPRTRVEQAEISIALSAFASIMILIPFAFVAASFVTPHVRERETGSKQMQYVSGVGGSTYWLASWLWDALLYLAVLVCTLGVFLLMGRDEFTGTAEHFGATAALLGGFGAAAIGFASVASFAFTTPSSALLLMIAFHFISGFGLVIVDTIFLIVGGSAYDVDKVLHTWAYPLFPAFCLGRGFIVLSTRSAFRQLPLGNRFHHTPPPLYAWDQLGSPLTFMLSECAISLIATLCLQALAARHASLSGWARALPFSSSPSASSAAATAPTFSVEPLPRAIDSNAVAPVIDEEGELEDESVRSERAAVDATALPPGGGGVASGSGETELVLRHLRKRYGGAGGKLAVRDLTLRVHAGECFGFLGVNGAGKSTTFAMLTGAVAPSSGDATLRGLSILSAQGELRKLVGFCPQHDALEALLTPAETLRLYAHIKGVPPCAIDAEIESLLRDLDLKPFEAKRAGTLSGGNKRKLCVAIALIGAPQLVLLDEPSSGMDAASKRFLWQVIKRRTASCCTILTTHSMEECEALCSRIGVMVDGSMRCLGPIQSLKSRYGQGYKLDLRLEAGGGGGGAANGQRPVAEQVLSAVAEGCPGARLEEAEPPCVTLTIPQRGVVGELSAIFEHLAAVRERCGVLECSLSQCTLEQVFLKLASKKGVRAAGAAAE